MVGDGGRTGEPCGVVPAHGLGEAGQPQVREVPGDYKRRSCFFARLQFPAAAQTAAQPAVERDRRIVAGRRMFVEQVRRMVGVRQRGRRGVAFLPA